MRLDEWEGPLGLLLALVEARRLDVMTVPLGGLAEAYLDAIAGIEGDRIGNLSAFIAVASQLILIKSRALLPRPPDPRDPAGRRARPRGRAASPAARLQGVPGRGRRRCQARALGR